MADVLKPKMTKAEAGRKGGLKTVERYGTGYMADIGRRGYLAVKDRYDLVPVNGTQWSLVSKTTGKVIAVWPDNGKRNTAT